MAAESLALIQKVVLWIALAAGCLSHCAGGLKGAEPDAVVDFATTIGRIKPLHGVNNGPVVRGENADLSGYHSDAGFPYTRLHDVHWPHPDAVDVSTIFPLFHADADDPQNYTFAKTDDYVAAIVKNNSQIVFRLGESIEPWTKFHSHPPTDFKKWAKVCVNIVRHYNDE
jgi:xylan 1,4-beta-xylosidase